MSQSFNDKNDQDTKSRKVARARFNSMFSDGRSFSGNERNCCYLNTDAFSAGGGRFANISAASGIDFADDGRAMVAVDWDQDGDLDIWTSNRNAPRLRFLRNNAPHANHFLAIRLTGNGNSTNRDAIGARVEVVLADTQIKNREDTTDRTNTTAHSRKTPYVKTLHAGEGFLSQNPKWLYFGLGAADRIDKVIVHWPGGKAEEFTDVDVDGRYILVQDSGVAEAISNPPRMVDLAASEQVSDTSLEGIFRMATSIELPPLPFETWTNKKEIIRPTKGQALLINFWASWCQPCLHELQMLGAAEEQIRSSGLDILALSVDGLNGEPLNADQAANILDTAHFHFRSGRANVQLVDQLKMLNVLKTEHHTLPLPFSVLLDYQGRLVAVYRGPISVEQVLKDITGVEGDILTRFERAAMLGGRALNHPVARDALQRAEADARFKYAHLLRQAGLLDMAVIQYEMLLRVFPQSGKAHSEIATLLSQLGKSKLAKEHLETALQIDPNSVSAHINLGGVYMNQQQHELAKTHYDKALELSSNDPQVFYNRALVHQAMDESDLALEDYSKAISLKPAFTQAYFQRGSLYAKLGDFKNALSDFSEAIRLEPDYAPAYKKRGLAALQAGLYEQSLLDLSTALKKMPTDEALYNNRGMAYAAAGQFAFALTDYNRAIKLNPDAPQIHNNLAWLLATCPDPNHRNGAQALDHAKRACELSQWSYSGALDTLAAAYAELGRFEDAIKWQTTSIGYAPEQDKADLRARLEMYKMKKPYRQQTAD